MLETGFWVMFAAITIAVTVTWFSTQDYEPAIHHQALRTAYFLPLILVPACIGIVGRQSLVNHRQMLEVTRLAHTDEMTGLANRRAFMQDATERLASTDVEIEGIAIFIVDLDHFKSVNDVYGHSAGDEVLIHAAKQMEKAVPHGSLICRLGGEEFAIMLGYRSVLDVHERAEEIRRRIASKPCTVGEHSISITASVGAGIAHSRDTVSSVMTRADNALYEAKGEGRNRFAIAA
jgi:diguanylate cyclase (GGDEF)-like protein